PEAEGEPGGRLERLLRAGTFAVTSEAVPPRSGDPAPLLEQVRALEGFADAVNVTDNPTARVHMSSLAGAAILAQAGLEPVVQLTVRDRNRMSLSSDVLGAWAAAARQRGLTERAFLVAGVAVAKSAASARYMREHLPGVTVPDEVIERLEGAGPGAQDEGVRIVADLIRALRSIPGMAGVHVMALGHPETVGPAVDAAGLLPRPA